ncbi:MAG: FtsK/SpoIIIE domain-containing protein, partial [Streptosporangiaceae bacterium]
MTNPRKMRRQARRIRRGGMQPTMLITGNDQFPESAAVLVLRWGWRYRSELAPLAPMAMALGVAWRLHAACPHWWGVALAIAGAAGWAVAIFGAKIGIPVLIERLYVATIAVLAGGWIAAATALGTFTSPLPQVLAIGGLVLSVPWWAHGRRRAKVRVDRKLEAWPDIAKAVGLAGSQVMSAVVDVWG